MAVLRLWPAANAFGRSISDTATRGLGRSASWQSRSIMAWSSGCSSGVVTFARIEARAILSPNRSCAMAKAAAITSTVTAPTPAAISAPMNRT